MRGLILMNSYCFVVVNDNFGRKKYIFSLSINGYPCDQNKVYGTFIFKHLNTYLETSNTLLLYSCCAGYKFALFQWF